MIRVCHSIATRFDGIVKSMENIVLSHLKTSQEEHNTVLKTLSEEFSKHTQAISSQSKQISILSQIQLKDNAKLLKLINLYSELATCGVMDGKRKESLKAEIISLINEK